MAEDSKELLLEERFLAYLDGELSPEERSRLDQELAANPDLRARFAQYRRTAQLLRSVGPTRAPATLLPALQRRMRRRRFQVPLALRFPYEGIAILVLIMGVMYAYYSAITPPWEEIVRTSAPTQLRLELTAAPDPALVKEYNFVPTAAPYGGKHLFVVRLDRERTLKLLDALRPITPKLPAPGDSPGPFELLVIAPL